MMAHYYLTIKFIHVLCAHITIFLLLLRIFLSVVKPNMLKQLWAKYLPHINDSVLLLSAILMLTVIGPAHSFVLAKIMMLCAYIVCGHIALKRTNSMTGKVIATSACLLIFYVMVGIGKYKSALSWWAY